MKKDLLERAERIARRIPKRKSEPKVNSEERSAKRQRHERIARRLEKKQQADRNFDRDLALVVAHTQEMRDVSYCYNRFTGKVDHGLVISDQDALPRERARRIARRGVSEQEYLPGDVRTRISEEPPIARPIRVPDADTVGAPVPNASGNWQASPLSRGDRQIEAYLCVRLEPRNRGDFPDWRRAWSANYKAHVKQAYGWKPFEKEAVGPNLAAAADWLTAKRHGHLFVNAVRGKPKAEDPITWESYGPPIPAHRGYDKTAYEILRNLDVADTNYRAASADAGRILTNDEAIRNIEEEGGAVGSRVAA